MGRRCRQQYFQQQPVIYYQPRRNRCQQPLQTNCQQAMQAPSCAAPRDTFSIANAASVAKVESKQAEPVVLSEANLKEYGLDQTKYSVTNFYEASFNINGTQVPYLIVHDLRKDAKVPIYMMPKAEAQSKSGNLWNEAQGTSSKHWKLANEALQKLVIAKTQMQNLEKKSTAPSSIGPKERAGDFEEKDFKLEEVKRETLASEPFKLRQSVLNSQAQVTNNSVSVPEPNVAVVDEDSQRPPLLFAMDHAPTPAFSDEDPLVEFATEPIKIPSPESLVLSGLTKAVKEIPNGLNVLKTMGADRCNLQLNLPLNQKEEFKIDRHYLIMSQ